MNSFSESFFSKNINIFLTVSKLLSSFSVPVRNLRQTFSSSRSHHFQLHDTPHVSNPSSSSHSQKLESLRLRVRSELLGESSFPNAKAAESKTKVQASIKGKVFILNVSTTNTSKQIGLGKKQGHHRFTQLT
jgi:hypothetical protein